MLRLKSTALLYCSVLLLLVVSATATAQEDKKKKSKIPQGTPVMWRDPVDLSSRNLLLGGGGEQMKRTSVKSHSSKIKPVDSQPNIVLGTPRGTNGSRRSAKKLSLTLPPTFVMGTGIRD